MKADTDARPPETTPDRPSSVRSDVWLAALTDGELSALICACQLADYETGMGRIVRPPWPQHGRRAHRKLIDAEFARAANTTGEAALPAKGDA